MKRTMALLAALLTLGAVLGITACEPKATVTARSDQAHPVAFTTAHIVGKVEAGGLACLPQSIPNGEGGERSGCHRLCHVVQLTHMGNLWQPRPKG